MKVIVDANIAFSAILNTNGKIGDLILNSKGLIEFVAPKYMLYEITKYHDKIGMISGMTKEEVINTQLKIFKPITFISEDQIPNKFWIDAEKITADIDPKDTPYIAYSKFLRIKLWTGDKILRNGLIKKGMKNTIITDELFEYRERRIKLHRTKKTKSKKDKK